MKRIIIILSFSYSATLFAQQKIVDNSEGLLNGPENLIVNNDDTRIMYGWNGVNFGWYDTKTGEEISTDATANTPHDLTRVGDMIFLRAKLGTGNPDLVYANVNDNAAVHVDYFDAPTYPMMHAQDGLGNYYGGGKFDEDETDADESPNRDFIKLDATKTTVSQPFNNRFGTTSASDNQDIASKLNSISQIVAFADDKVLAKAYRTTGSGDVEFFVYDAGDNMTTQVTDQANEFDNGTPANVEEYPLASPFGNSEVAFYHENNGTIGIYTTDGLTSTLVSNIAATAFDFTSFIATSTEILWVDTDGGDEELYYSTGTASTKVDINGSGSSSPRNFVSNGDKVLFVANDGSRNELYYYTGSGSYTKVLFDESSVAITPFTDVTIPTIEATGNGFIFIHDSGSGNQIYFTDGTNTVLLDNGYDYDGFIGARMNQTFVSSEYYYFTDNDKDIISIAIPDNIYNGTEWSNGTPDLSQSLYINSDITFSENFSAHSIHLPKKITLTVNNNATLTIDNNFYNKGTVIEDDGTLSWQEPISTVTLNPIINTVTDFLDTAQVGTAKNQFPEYAITQLTDSLNKANTIKSNPESIEQVQSMADSLYAVFIDVLWQKVQEEVVYTNNLEYVLGDLKQAQIQNLLTTKSQADYLLLGMREARFNGIRITLFADGVNPNEEMFDYLYEQAVKRGFKIFANPAQSSGGRRVACEMLNGDICETRDIDIRTNILINRVKAFANAYKVDWINPFNEDGTPSHSWSENQMNTIYSTLQNAVNGAELIGPCVWGLPGGIEVLQQTDVLDYVSISTSHNLGFNHGLWDDFIALSGDLPVWESEATHNEKDGNASRLLTAVEVGVQGLVFYDNWRTINLSNGSLNGLGLDALSIYASTIVEATGVTVTGEATVPVGRSVTLSAEVSPTDNTNKGLVWSSSDEAIATVNENGVVSGLSLGEAVIAATTTDGSEISGSFTLTVTAAIVSSISIAGDESIIVGNTVTLTTEILPTDAADKSITWSSSDESIATVDENGVVSGLNVGEAVVTATANDGSEVTASFTLTVAPLLISSIEIIGEDEMDNQTNQRLNALTLPENATDNSVTWTSSDPTIATVSEAGLVNAVSDGSVTITATANDVSGVSNNFEITVIEVLADSKILSFSVYPNPSEEVFRIDLPKSLEENTYHIFNTAGQLIQSGQLYTSKEIKLNNDSKGIFNLIIKSGNQVYSSRLLIK